jgi:hypothetical protein
MDRGGLNINNKTFNFIVNWESQIAQGGGGSLSSLPCNWGVLQWHEDCQTCQRCHAQFSSEQEQGGMGYPTQEGGVSNTRYQKLMYHPHSNYRTTKIQAIKGCGILMYTVCPEGACGASFRVVPCCKVLQVAFSLDSSL